MKVLVMGLPGSGKTTLCKLLKIEFNCAWFNADAVRNMANDWDFSPAARLRQASRMRHLCDFESGSGKIVLCDFVCPTEKTREIFGADFTIWMNTIEFGRYEDTNSMFQPNHNANLTITKLNYDWRLVADIVRDAN